MAVAGFNFDLEHSNDQHILRMGAEGQYNTLVSTANETSMSTGTTSSLDTRYPDGDNSMMNAALYFSHIWNMSDHTTITDGIRVGFVSLHSTLIDTSFFRLPFASIDQKNPVYSGSIGITHTPDDETKLSFLVSTGYRVPNIDDLSKIFESSPGNLIVPNANLKPEKTINAEWGITKIIRERTKWTSTVYYTELYNAIQTSAFQWNGKDSVLYNGELSQVLANQNSGKGYIYGFSSSLQSQLSPAFLLNASANYTYGRLRTDSSDVPLDHVAPLMARVQLTYTHEKFSSDFFVNYQSAKKLANYSSSGEDNLNYATPTGMPAWYTLNWRLNWKINSQFQAVVGV
ncbi:MAG: TonB-dependent receptor plug domain-containing protein, partial [Flavobacteriales bacterium]